MQFNGTFNNIYVLGPVVNFIIEEENKTQFLPSRSY